MLADQIKRHRKAAGLTQSEFAKRFHVATGTIGMWETGRREPNYRTLVKLAVFFGVSVDELLGEEEPPGAAEESGARVPSGEAIVAMARLFDTSTDFLLGLVDDQVRLVPYFRDTTEDEQLLLQAYAQLTTRQKHIVEELVASLAEMDNER